jgi:hypothetical protein
MKGKQPKRTNSTKLYLFVGLELGQMTKWTWKQRKKWSLPGKVEVLKGPLLEDGQKELNEKAKKELRTNLIVQSLVQSEFEKSLRSKSKHRRRWSS